ncbi:MAG: YncE family protein [Thermoplasmata archaeon]
MKSGKERVWKVGAMLAVVGAIAVAVLMIVPAGSLAHPVVVATSTAPHLGLTGAANVASAAAKATKVTKHSTCTVGNGPALSGYDPVTHTVYVPNQGSGTITVLKGTCTVAGTIALPAGAAPSAAAFDPQNNYVYVTDKALDHVYQISGTTIKATISSALFDGPFGIAYDPGNASGYMLVSNLYGTTVVGISGTTVRGPIPVGLGPDWVSYDPSRNTILVADGGGSNVTILSAYYPFGSYRLSANVGTSPVGIAYDPADALDYVANYGSANVSAIGGFGELYGTISHLTGAFAVGWSQSDLRIFVTSVTADKIWEISLFTVTKTISTPSGSNTESATYNEYNDMVYVSDYSSDKVYVYS